MVVVVPVVGPDDRVVDGIHSLMVALDVVQEPAVELPRWSQSSPLLLHHIRMAGPEMVQWVMQPLYAVVGWDMCT